jgi:hypothetical protein
MIEILSLTIGLVFGFFFDRIKERLFKRSDKAERIGLYQTTIKRNDISYDVTYEVVESKKIVSNGLSYSKIKIKDVKVPSYSLIDYKNHIIKLNDNAWIDSSQVIWDDIDQRSIKIDEIINGK